MSALPPMHPGQLTPTAADVAGLIREQFPAWAGRRVRPVDSPGTVNALFRLGDDLVARLPLNPGDPEPRRAEQAREFALAERLLHAGLPVGTPYPVTTGAPGNGFPLPWSVWRWLPGRTAYDLDVADDVGVARGVAGYVRAVRAIDTDGAVFTGTNRGGRLRDHDDTVAGWITDATGLLDTDAVTRLWHDHGNYAQTVTIDSWREGARRLISKQDLGACAPLVEPGLCYRLRVNYEATAPTYFMIYYRNNDGSWRDWARSPSIPPSSRFHTVTWDTPPLPDDAVAASVGLSITHEGSLTVDDFTLTQLGPYTPRGMLHMDHAIILPEGDE